MTLKEFLAAPPAYAPGSGLKLYITAPLAVAIFIIGQLAATGFFFAFGGQATDLVAAAPGGIGPSSNQITTGQLVIVLVSQIITIAMTLAAAGAAPGGLVQALRLGEPVGGNRAYVYALLLLVPALAVINLAAYLASPATYLDDFRIFLQTVRGDRPLVAVAAIGAGAPLSEELLFRGFLLASAVTTSIPFWPAAVLVNTAWTALHIQYSWIGILEVFAIGLFLSWTLWKTGSLRVPLVCHAVYNSSLFLLMRYLPLG
jgi:uncharacterized protein